MLLGALISAVVMMIWGFAFWAGAGNVIKPTAELANEGPVRAALSAIPESGVYVIPGGTMAGTDEETAAAAQRHEAGPIATIFLRKAGAPVMGRMVLVKGMVHYFVVALLLGLILKQVRSAVPLGGSRLGLAVMIGVIATVGLYLSEPIWWYQSWRFWIISSVYGVGMYTLAGLVMGRFVDA
jgi:hypothetical protein